MRAVLKKREHPGAIEALETLIEVSSSKLEIAQVLEPIYTAKQDHERLAWVLEQRLQATEDVVQRKGLLRRIGDVYENRLQRKERAFDMARQSLPGRSGGYGCPYVDREVGRRDRRTAPARGRLC
ncbi:MAG: hypothetical protein R3C68_14880 [Myxococcota bacterium]